MVAALMERRHIRLLIVGNDKIGRCVAARLSEAPGLLIAVDLTPRPARVLRLLRRGSLSLLLLAKMVLAEALRPDTQVRFRHQVRGIDSLRSMIDSQSIEEIYLFRAGLIINRDLLGSGVPFFNCHCARLDGFGGLGAIDRALRKGELRQAATLHRVTETIDSGEIIALEPYWLDPQQTYRANEDIAYNAGIQLLSRILLQADAPT
jgi:methionyl-tRNA formyltransferase